jgi:hypothetical protein
MQREMRSMVDVGGSEVRMRKGGSRIKSDEEQSRVVANKVDHQY